MLSIIKACYGLERVLWTGKGKPESERNGDVLKICEYRRENMGGMDMFVGEQMNLLELDLSSLYCQGEFQYPLTSTKFIICLRIF